MTDTVADQVSRHEEALTRLPSLTRIEVDGTLIAVRSWGERDRPWLVLLHGGAAHAGWWDHIAPGLAHDFHVVAPDLSGHGDSGWRWSYSLSAWASEIAAVIAERPDGVPVVLVGHSMGGHVALTLGARLGETRADELVDELAGVLVIDSEILPRADQDSGRRWAPAAGAERRVHPDEATILSRFRTLPDDCAAPAHVLDHVARHSITPHRGGWAWKFDVNFVTHDLLAEEDLAPLSFPVRVMRGERGLVPDAMADAVRQRLGVDEPVVTVPDSGHHVPLEQPELLAEAVAEIAGTWLRPPPATPDPDERPDPDRNHPLETR